MIIIRSMAKHAVRLLLGAVSDRLNQIEIIIYGKKILEPFQRCI